MTMTMRCLVAGAVFALLLAVPAGCARSANQMADTAAPIAAGPMMGMPVGPVPGPAVNPPGRGNPYRDDQSARVEGRRLFVQFNCSGCHGGRAGGGMGPSLRDVDWIYGSTDDQIFSSIAQGRAHGMPAWGMQLNEDQVWKLVAYVTSLRTSAEPHPPN